MEIELHRTINEKAEEKRLGLWSKEANEPEDIPAHAIEVFYDVGNGIFSQNSFLSFAQVWSITSFGQYVINVFPFHCILYLGQRYG